MNDPWDVKSVRRPDQYVSCIKLNGVALLPPLLSKECRKEMQYYKLLAKEVENRLSLLEQCNESEPESEENTDAPELPEHELLVDTATPREVDVDSDVGHAQHSTRQHSPPHVPATHTCNKVLIGQSLQKTSSKCYADKLLINKRKDKNVMERCKSPKSRSLQSPPVDIPERDLDSAGKVTQKGTVILKRKCYNSYSLDEADNRYHNSRDDAPSATLMEFDGLSSLSAKSFTGSLNDLHSDSVKDQTSPKLLRQSSYTLLQPSPLLLAHLEVQSLSTGVEMSSISMSESQCNLASPSRKRRSWDLETAKAKWSTMALELKQKNIVNTSKHPEKHQQLRKSPQSTPSARAKHGTTPNRRSNATPKSLPKSEPFSKSDPIPKRRAPSPIRKSRTFVKDPSPPRSRPSAPARDALPPQPAPAPASESEDPAARVRELYEKIQKQQLIQMATLVEKQKKEQLLLQQVFEEQNNLLFKQLKTICPKSPVEAKAAWEEARDEERGPVSLSQLINYKSDCRTPSAANSDKHTGRSSNHQTTSQSGNGPHVKSLNSQPEGSRTRTHSPTQRNAITPRRLIYETSASTDRELEPMLTDRTNDTLADLNVTFPSDPSSDDDSVIRAGSRASPDRQTLAARDTQKSIQDSLRTDGGRAKHALKCQPTPEQRAAATTIVAHARGYLVRRLLRTERVQATVRTIRDALLCALALHRDRLGIRGADVDLHRRLIQQITAACYSLHETFVASSPAERCAVIAADRARRRAQAARRLSAHADVMSQSHSGAFPARAARAPASPMTQSNYETSSGDKSAALSRRCVRSPRARAVWR